MDKYTVTGYGFLKIENTKSKWQIYDIYMTYKRYKNVMYMYNIRNINNKLTTVRQQYVNSLPKGVGEIEHQI